MKTLTGHTDTVRCLIESPGQKIASGSQDYSIRIWSIKTGDLLQILNGHSGRERSFILLNDGISMASCSDDKTIRLWNTSKNKLIRQLQEHNGYVHSLALEENQRLFSGSSDGSIIVWKFSY